jgi:hypothetical protein
MGTGGLAAPSAFFVAMLRQSRSVHSHGLRPQRFRAGRGSHRAELDPRPRGGVRRAAEVLFQTLLKNAPFGSGFGEQRQGRAEFHFVDCPKDFAGGPSLDVQERASRIPSGGGRGPDGRDRPSPLRVRRWRTSPTSGSVLGPRSAERRTTSSGSPSAQLAVPGGPARRPAAARGGNAAS